MTVCPVEELQWDPACLLNRARGTRKSIGTIVRLSKAPFNKNSFRVEMEMFKINSLE
jgi:hypothetical protein